MLVKYYKNQNLSYSTRKRYKKITLTPLGQEEQRSILLGDGAETSVKTKASNICDYVIITDNDNIETRWFVTSYVYLNGGQVKLFLQRDVIGEKGIDSCYGKIERGFTDTILKRRKELDVNQILKSRKYLQPNKMQYGNLSVNTHDNEMWGILYLVKPTTGEDKVNINIPGFSPKVDETLGFIEQQTNFTKNIESVGIFEFNLELFWQNGSDIHRSYYKCSFRNRGQTMIYTTKKISSGAVSVVLERYQYTGATSVPTEQNVVDSFCNYVYTKINTNNDYFEIPHNINVGNSYINYNNKSILYNDEYYQYSVSVNTVKHYFDTKDGRGLLTDYDSEVSGSGYWKSKTIGTIPTVAPNSQSFNYMEQEEVTYSILQPEDTGTLVLDIVNQLVSEPFYIMCFPLFDCTITLGIENWNISRDVAFNIFNTVIQYLSGENGYLVDAQIYPYCPDIDKKQSEFKNPKGEDKYPFFSIMSSNYERECSIDLLPYEDVKKDYICRQYSIVSPDQSGKYSFNFYDYKKEAGTLNIVIKTSLKPYAIISSAIILRDEDVLAGKTYSSDLIGCQSTGSGFECSLSTNQFQQYVRNNSNYDKFFAKDQEALQKQHQVEKVNEKVSAIVNTISAAAMGTIGGGSLGATIGGSIGGPVGAGIGLASGMVSGGAIAAGTVAGMMTWQYKENEKLRQYEEKLQQEKFDLTIGTIKNLPNTVSRISSFNEIIMRDFWFVIEIYECSEDEIKIVDRFIENYGYSIGVYDFFQNFVRDKWFIRGSLIVSNMPLNLHEIAKKELAGGVYIYEQV